MCRTAAASLAVLLTVLPIHAAAVIYTVSPDGLGDLPTIQAAVDTAEFGDVVLLTDGTFTGDGNRDIVVPSETFIIRSESGDPNACIIDCQGSARDEHRALHFTSEGAGFVTLSGIAIINGYVSGHGGGIWVEGASPFIANCAIAMCAAGATGRGGGLYVSDGGNPSVSASTFASNTAGYGGGIAVWLSTLVCQQTEINDNEADEIGGGIYAQSSGGSLVHLCEITSNSADRAGGIRWAGSVGEPTISASVIARNESVGHSGGVWLQGGLITECSIIENSAGLGGGGVFCAAGTGGIHASIIAFSEDGEGIGADETYEPIVTCCDVYGNADGEYDATVGDLTGTDGNFSDDPELCGLQSEDYTLDASSPCLPGGNDCGFRIGALGQGCDSPVESTSWGRIKAFWR